MRSGVVSVTGHVGMTSELTFENGEPRDYGKIVASAFHVSLITSFSLGGEEECGGRGRESTDSRFTSL